MVCALAGACSDGDADSAGTIREAGNDGTVANPRNCEDTTLSPRTYYKDADDDGFGTPGSDVVHGCFAEPPSGYADNGKDCDDADADKHVMRYRDEDGDGYGAPGSEACVGTQDADYVDRDGDCDDHDSDRSPGVAEHWLDGIDQDCDGSDDLHGCIAPPDVDPKTFATTDVIPFPDLSDVRVERREGCPGGDLYFVLLGACPVCGGGRATAVVGNRGTAPVAFALVSNAERLEVDTPLAPQALSKALSVKINSPESELRIELTGDAEDCAAEDNSRSVDVGFVDCDAP